MMNISLIIVIIFVFLGYHLICKPLAFLLHKSKKIIIDNMENAYKLEVPLTVDIGVGENWLEAH